MHDRLAPLNVMSDKYMAPANAAASLPQLKILLVPVHREHISAERREPEQHNAQDRRRELTIRAAIPKKVVWQFHGESGTVAAQLSGHFD